MALAMSTHTANTMNLIGLEYENIVISKRDMYTDAKNAIDIGISILHIAHYKEHCLFTTLISNS